MKPSRNIPPRKSRNRRYLLIRILIQPKHHHRLVDIPKHRDALKKLLYVTHLFRRVIRNVHHLAKSRRHRPSAAPPKRRHTSVQRHPINPSLKRQIRPIRPKTLPNIHKHILIKILQIFRTPRIPKADAPYHSIIIPNRLSKSHPPPLHPHLRPPLRPSRPQKPPHLSQKPPGLLPDPPSRPQNPSQSPGQVPFVTVPAIHRRPQSPLAPIAPLPIRPP